MTSMEMQRDNLRGGMLMGAAMAAFAVEDALIKGLTSSLPTGQIILLVGGIGAVILAVIAKLSGAPLWSRAFFRPAVILRNLGEFVAAIAFITSLKLLPLSTASAILQTLPLAITMGAALFLNESVGWRRWSAIMVGFIGVMIVLRPTGEDFDLLAAGAAFLTVAGLALRDLATRRVGPDVPSLSLGVWGLASYGVAGILLMGFSGQSFERPPLGLTLYACAAACIGLIGYYLMIVATRIGEVAAIMPYRYARLVFALIFGWIFYAETPDAWMFIGCALIVGSGFYTFLRERYHAFHASSKRVKGQ